MRETIRKVLKRQDLINERPPQQWGQGVPLGNGDIGAMVWGGPDAVHFTLGKNGFWDLRLDENDDPRFTWESLSRMITQGEWETLKDVWSKVKGAAGVTPTALPVGRMTLEFDLRDLTCSFRERLDLHGACLDRRIRHHQRHMSLECFASSLPSVFCIKARNHNLAKDLRVRFTRELRRESEDYESRLGYPPIETLRQNTRFGFLQEIPDSMVAVTLVSAYRGRRRVRLELEGDVHVSVMPSAPLMLYVVVTTGKTREEAIEQAEVNLHLAETAGYEKLKAAHRTQWEEFWGRSSVSLSHRRLENLWYLEMYKLASCSRKGLLPSGLQGLWPADGRLPSWGGDYHANINLQQTYWPVYTSNHLELGEPLYDWLLDILPRARSETKAFYGADGACVPTITDPLGRRLPGWVTVQLWPMAGPWLAHHFWLHYRHTLDRDFLRDRAYPFMLECLRLCEQLWQEDEDGRPFLYPTHSPELFGDAPEAWCRNATLDLCLMQSLLGSCIEASEVLEADPEDRERWRDLLSRLPGYPTTDGHLCEWEGECGERSHRHLSRLAPIYPIGDVNVDGPPDEAEVARSSLLHSVRRGYGRWMGWSFPWAACIGARLGWREFAAQMLECYLDSFIEPNTFHVAGDYRRRGISGLMIHTPSVEAGFGAAAAIGELLLQSWGGKLRIFPGLPDSWDASFRDLRAENAFLVSAEQVDGRTGQVVIQSLAGAQCVLVCPFPRDRTIVRSGEEDVPLEWKGDELAFPTVAGQTYTVQDRDEPHALVFRSVPVRPQRKSNFFGIK